MSEYLEAFVLGNGAILGNVCLLPLYPGLFVLLSDRVERGASPQSVRWMGVLVLAGVLTVMVSLGALMAAVSATFSQVLPYVLPVLYGLVLLLGVAMILDRNPLARVATTEAPIFRNPHATAFAYGVAIGPMTLPCTGPLIVSAFVLGGVAGTGATLDSLTYFFFFGLGFGWPLVVLPLLAAPLQRRLTQFLGRNHTKISIVSGVLLIGVAVVGLYTDVFAT